MYAYIDRDFGCTNQREATNKFFYCPPKICFLEGGTNPAKSVFWGD